LVGWALAYAVSKSLVPLGPVGSQGDAPPRGPQRNMGTAGRYGLGKNNKIAIKMNKNIKKRCAQHILHNCREMVL